MAGKGYSDVAIHYALTLAVKSQYCSSLLGLLFPVRLPDGGWWRGGTLDLVAIDYAVGLCCRLPPLGIFSLSDHQAGRGSGGEGI